MFRLTASGVPPPGAVFFLSICGDLFQGKALTYQGFFKVLPQTTDDAITYKEKRKNNIRKENIGM
ncbi:hypothetical protein [Faecalibacterium duncaniae]|uniref:hypothetical protein n=1 Tax=Faecalibacterium duncaniae (strain DSM 17677 / JCM 31915 / A2-165) TaxID=411483 RepID=UPI002940FE7D|nr:hypothetical protein [Faecalibacterium duncaniae]MDV5041758.1 hypothetical protein [Faecalibacterium duncaniae]